jgi:hypothetical protein
MCGIASANLGDCADEAIALYECIVTTNAADTISEATVSPRTAKTKLAATTLVDSLLVEPLLPVTQA